MPFPPPSTIFWPGLPGSVGLNCGQMLDRDHERGKGNRSERCTQGLMCFGCLAGFDCGVNRFGTPIGGAPERSSARCTENHSRVMRWARLASTSHSVQLVFPNHGSWWFAIPVGERFTARWIRAFGTTTTWARSSPPENASRADGPGDEPFVAPVAQPQSDGPRAHKDDTESHPEPDQPGRPARCPDSDSGRRR